MLHGGAAAVVVIDAHGLAVARRLRASAAPALRVVAVAEAQAPQADETLIVPADPAPVAVDLALLACHGVALPPKVALGLRVVDTANAAAGGVARLGPGDIGLAALARQHAEQLTTKPTTDVVFRVGLVAADGGDGWPLRAHAAARAAAARYPQLVIEGGVAAGGPVRVAAALRERLDANVRVLVVALADPQPLAELAARAAELRIPIVAIDPSLRAATAACVVGSDPAAVGRALGAAARAALPTDAAIALLRPQGAEAVETAFREALARNPQ
ncbi:MAG: substrate-binding domain-containing protein [Planctomycetes bacterium]|nr:substrate-binding domain-containing protein [Planctomycetota bacterium]